MQTFEYSAIYFNVIVNYTLLFHISRVYNEGIFCTSIEAGHQAFIHWCSHLLPVSPNVKVAHEQC
jgi:hypothetical protein